MMNTLDRLMSDIQSYANDVKSDGFVSASGSRIASLPPIKNSAAAVQAFKADVNDQGFRKAASQRIWKLFVTDRNPDEEKKTLAFGLLVQSDRDAYSWHSIATQPYETITDKIQYPVRKLTQYTIGGGKDGAQYYADPLNVLYQAFEKRRLKPDRKLGGLPRFVGYTFFYYNAGIDSFDNMTEKSANSYLLSYIKNDHRFDDLKQAYRDKVINQTQFIMDAQALYSVYNDYRFDDIREQLVAKKMDAPDAIEAAMDRTQSISDYYSKMKSLSKDGASPSLAQNMGFIDTNSSTTPLFTAINPYLNGSYQQRPELIIDPKQKGQPLSDDKKQALFEIEHDRYEFYNAIEAIFGPGRKGAAHALAQWISGSKDSLPEPPKDPYYKGIYDLLIRDSFVQQVLKQEQEGKLKPDGVPYWIMADVDVQLKLKELLISGARLRATQNGQFTDQPMDLNDLENSLLARLKSDEQN